MLPFNDDHYPLKTLGIKSLELDHSGTYASHAMNRWGKTQSHDVTLATEEVRLNDPQNSPMGLRTLRHPGQCSPQTTGITAFGFSAAFNTWPHSSVHWHARADAQENGLSAWPGQLAWTDPSLSCLAPHRPSCHARTVQQRSANTMWQQLCAGPQSRSGLSNQARHKQHVCGGVARGGPRSPGQWTWKEHSLWRPCHRGAYVKDRASTGGSDRRDEQR